MRVMTIVLLVGALAGQVLGQEDGRRAQVRAAQANAVSALRDDVARAPITDNLTVRDFLDRTNGAEQLTQVLQRAEQIGGPRWLSADTCQVHLAISGTRVAHVLGQIAAANPKTSPLPPEVMQRHLVGLNERTFTATGTSTGAAAAGALRPVDDAWAGVNETVRRTAVSAAIASAAQKVADSIRPVVLAEDYTAGEALGQPEAGQAFTGWLTDRPVTKVDFREDLQVEVALSAPPGEVTEALRTAVTRDKATPAKVRSADWGQVEQRVAKAIAPAVGRGKAERPATKPLAMAVAPAEMPRWVGQRMTAEGRAEAQNSRLKTARRAEEAALKNLENQVNALALTPKMTVGDAGAADANLKDRLGLVVRLAQTEKVDYREDGSVVVRVGLDLRDVWEALLTPRR